MKPAHRSLAVTVVALLLALAVPAAHAGLVGWWTFDNTLIDSGTNGNDGVFSGSGSLTYVADRDGNPNAAAQFDGGDNKVTVGTTGRPTNTFTFSAWIQSDVTHQIDGQSNSGTVGTSGQRYAFGASQGGTNAGAGLSYGTNGISVYEHGNSYMPATAVYSSAGVGSGWNYVTVVYNDRRPTIYLNGDAVRTGVTSARSTVLAPIEIGGGSYNDVGITPSPAQKLMDDVAVWDQALSPIDIKNLANGSITPAGVATYDLANVTYRIQVGSPPASTSGNTTVKAYATDDVDELGSQFASTSSGSNQVTATGTVPWRVGMTDYFQVEATHRGTIDDIFEAPSVTAVFTAPMGYRWVGGNQYLATTGGTGTPWTASSYQWENALYTHGDGGVTYVRTVTTPNPAPTGFPAGSNPQSIWGDQTPGDPMSPTTYLDVAGQLEKKAWDLLYEPQGDPGTGSGLSAHVVRVNNNLDNLGQVDTALGLRRDVDANHNVSQVFGVPGVNPLSNAHFDLAGNYPSPSGVLPGDHTSTAGNPEDYAMRIAGYFEVTEPQVDTQRSFAISGDDRFYFKVGDFEWARSEAVVSSPPTVVSMNFTAAGYYPFELTWANRAGGGGIELSSRAGTWDAADWLADPTQFQIVGTDANFVVYQNPDALNVSDYGAVGANTVGGAVYQGSLGPSEEMPTDGFRIQQASGSGGSLAAARGFYADKIITDGDTTLYNTGSVADGVLNPALNPSRVNLDLCDPGDGGGDGNYSVQNPMPFATTAGNQDNFATRINGLLYVPTEGMQAFAVNTDNDYSLRIGNQQLGSTSGRNGVLSGTANYVYGYFTPGLYPFEFYHNESTGQADIELARGGSTSLLFSTSRDPASNGFTTDWGGVAYTVQPVAKLSSLSLAVTAKAFGHVPALAGVLNAGGTVNPESWKLEEKLGQTATMRTPDPSGPGYIQGLRGRWYNNEGWTSLAYDSDTGGYYYNEVARANGVYPPGTFWTGNVDTMSARFTGKIYVENAGRYVFGEHVDDEAWIYIDGGLILNNNQYNVSTRASVDLTAGWHDIDLRTRDGSTGDASYFFWDFGTGLLPAWGNTPTAAQMDPWILRADYMQDEWALLNEGVFAVGDLADFEDLWDFTFGTTHSVRLTVSIAGLTAVAYLNDILFVPEPATMVLLAAGLLAVVRRRRRNRR